MKEKTASDGDVLRIVGTMSGTSLDGVDAAILETDGVTVHGFGPCAYRPYAAAERAILRAALGRWPGDPGVEAAARVVEAAHTDILADLAADFVGFHGQTLAHDPAGLSGHGPRTHQAGDGARLAAAFGRPVIWDFRSADVAAGGQGAPLAPAYHFALARRLGATAPLAFLNLGGVGNLTWLDPLADDAFAPGAMLAFDTGPANAPLNDLMRARCGLDLDADGALAAQGRAHAGCLSRFFAHAYFDVPPPKSLDRDAFADLAAAVAELDDADAAATLVEAAVQGVARALHWCPVMPERLLVTGGGRRNPLMMARLAASVPCRVGAVEDAGFDGDMLEAQAFAFLAARVLRGLPLSGSGSTGVATPLCGGRIDPPVG